VDPKIIITCHCSITPDARIKPGNRPIVSLLISCEVDYANPQEDLDDFVLDDIAKYTIVNGLGNSGNKNGEENNNEEYSDAEYEEAKANEEEIVRRSEDEREVGRSRRKAPYCGLY
ncbi:hypothetical protein BGX27_003437, partial [Mortierella sp. AM989]